MAIITGTNGDDPQLNGTNLADEIYALGGNDTLIGYDGDYVLEGGAGADDLFGSAGFDYASYRGSDGGRLHQSGRQLWRGRPRRGRPPLQHRGCDRLRLQATIWSAMTSATRFGARAGRTPSSVGSIADALLAARRVLARELQGLETRVRWLARDDKRARLLMSAPGVGSIVALTYVAAIDDPGRFRSSKAAGAHFGLTPRGTNRVRPTSPLGCRWPAPAASCRLPPRGRLREPVQLHRPRSGWSRDRP